MRFFKLEKMKIYYDYLIDHTKNIWKILDEQKEMIEALENTNNALVSYKLNEIMKVLTIFSVIFVPITFLTNVFGMSLIKSMPLFNNPLGFWIIIDTMAIVVLIMILFFKRKKWL